MCNKYFYFCCIVSTAISFASCNKYLDAKSDPSLSTPNTLTDLQSVLDFPDITRTLSLTNVGTDEYFAFPEANVTGSDKPNQDQYIWSPDTRETIDWYNMYNYIFYTNTVLDNLEKIPAQGQEAQWNVLKGWALFLRAYCHYQLVQEYALQYDKNSAATDLGIPLRLNSNFNEATTRSTIQQNYDQVINDLQTAATLLPATTLYKTRPNQTAASAMLARVYLQMGDFTKAKEYANSALQLQSTLLNYASDPEINAASATPFKLFNKEVIYYSFSDRGLTNRQSTAKIDSNLYKSYNDNDLRKVHFFRPNPDGTFSFEGSYNESTFSLFTGLAVDEMYLIRAECFARLGDATSAMQDLNALLLKRWSSSASFVPYTASSSEQALNYVLAERKKELIFRGIRWSDLKRLNKEPARAVTLTRKYLGQTYTLPPNDNRYALLIPQLVIDLSGIPQNPR